MLFSFSSLFLKNIYIREPCKDKTMKQLTKQYITQLYQKRIKVTVMVSMPYLTIVIIFLIKSKSNDEIGLDDKLSKVTTINSLVSDSEKE